MSLQGSLETFALRDVLHLLSATEKTGELQVRTKRNNGCLWVKSGVLVGGSAGDSNAIVDSVFALMRSNKGTFSFIADRAPAEPSLPLEVAAVLVDVELRLGEWREIEAVVPSTYCLLHLVPEIPGEVKLSPEDWEVVSRIGSGTKVLDIMRSLSIDEFVACKRVKHLSEKGVVMVGAPTDDEPLFHEPETETNVEFLVPTEGLDSEPEADNVEDVAPISHLTPVNEPETEEVDDAETIARWDEIRRIAEADGGDLGEDLTPEEQVRAKELIEAEGAATPEGEVINRGALLKLLASAQTSA